MDRLLTRPGESVAVCPTEFRDAHSSREAAAAAIDLETEKLICLSEAVKLLPSNTAGKSNPHIASLLRWIQHGTRGVYLGGLRVGGRWCTTKEAIGRYISACTASEFRNQPLSATTSQAPGARRPAAVRADNQLAALGV